MTRSIEQLTAESISLWRGAATCLPVLGRQFTAAEQSRKELLLDLLMASLESELCSAPRTRGERAGTHARISSAFAEFARTALELEDCHLALLLNNGFSAIGTTLGRLARRFDPKVGGADILQACRNVWAACGLQALFGLPTSVTPGIFAYSMLYPYSDNYLDDAAVPRARKLTFSEQFRRRLAGENVAASRRLAGCFYQRRRVLADAYLAAGRLSDVEEGFASIGACCCS